MGGVHEGEEVGVLRAERGAEVHGEAEIGCEVSNLGHEEAPPGCQKEEAVHLGGEAWRELGGATERGEVGGERLRGGVSATARVERLGESGCDVGAWKRRNSAGYRSTNGPAGGGGGAAGGRGSGGSGGARGAGGSGAAERSRTRLAGEAEAVGARRLAVQRRAPHQLRRRD